MTGHFIANRCSTFSLDMTPDSSAIASFVGGDDNGGIESVSSAMGALQLGNSPQKLRSICC
jgi:hypothetical protein